MLLQDKRLLISGVATTQSIAFSVAARAQQQGAHVVLTTPGRYRQFTEEAAAELPRPAEIFNLDVARPNDPAECAEAVEKQWGGLDGALHAIAFAPEDCFGGNFLAAPERSAVKAFRVSAFSFKTFAEHLCPLMPRKGGSLVGLDFDATVAWPIYDWMGVAKAALESVSRYLARYLGERQIRVNLVAAGPLATVAASAIPGFDALANGWSAQAPLGWDTEDPTAVADATCFLLSDLARGITGEMLHVDGGFHAMGAPLDPNVLSGIVADEEVSAGSGAEA